MKTPKYKTIYPKNFKAILNFDFQVILWAKNKDTKKYLEHNFQKEMNVNQISEYLNNERSFCIKINELYISNCPSDKCPKRILIKYIS